MPVSLSSGRLRSDIDQNRFLYETRKKIVHSSINRLQTMGFLNFCVGYIVTTDWRSWKRGVLFKPFERNSRVAYGAFFSRAFLFTLFYRIAWTISILKIVVCITALLLKNMIDHGLAPFISSSFNEHNAWLLPQQRKQHLLKSAPKYRFEKEKK